MTTNVSSTAPDSGRIAMLGIAAIVVVLDQVTKALALAYLPLHGRSPVIDGYLTLTHVRNRGMAFGLFNSAQADWVRWALIVLALAAIAIIWTYARQAGAHTGVMLAFGAILGGAVGNLIDRVRFGYVVDFILAHWGRHEWPAFNVADSAITIGGIALFLALATERDDPDILDEANSDNDADAPTSNVTRDPA